MKLKIERNQQEKKGFLGGNKGIEFTLKAQVKLSDEEKRLIDKAKLGDYILTEYTRYEDSKGGAKFPLRVETLINGMVSSVIDVQKLLALEEEIEIGCRNLKSLLSVIDTFGGEEIIEI